ncbi:hypothetical protein pipiens_009130 [Culex pipiens pipiens]|uniref:Mediator of RNA polymerase II transcription subunit 15 n=1 Tax=Culex pipiens pipiens TaxID=38569 RepID=A0ABD1DEW5_CULPP
MSDESWRRPSFRHSVVNKINDCIQSTGLNSSRNGQEMESHVFQRAQNKDEYLGFVARLILHIREIGQKQNVQQNSYDSEEEWVDR